MCDHALIFNSLVERGIYHLPTFILITGCNKGLNQHFTPHLQSRLPFRFITLHLTFHMQSQEMLPDRIIFSRRYHHCLFKNRGCLFPQLTLILEVQMDVSTILYSLHLARVCFPCVAEASKKAANKAVWCEWHSVPLKLIFPCIGTAWHIWPRVEPCKRCLWHTVPWGWNVTWTTAVWLIIFWKLSYIQVIRLAVTCTVHSANS